MAIAFSEETGNWAAGSGSSLAAGAQNHANASLIVVFTHCVGSTTISSVSDTAGNSYSKAIAGNAAGWSMEIWYAYDITGNANNVVTATWSSSTVVRGICVHEYTGDFTNGDPYDSGDEDVAGGSGTTASTSNSTQDLDASGVVCGWFATDTDKTFTAGTNFTLRGNAGNGFSRTEDRITSSTGSYNASITWSGSASWSAIHAIFCEPPAAGGTTHNVSIVDATKLNDALSAAIDYALEISDSAKFNDVVNTLVTFLVTSVDSSKFSDIPSAIVNFILNVSEATKLSDTPSIFVTKELTVVDAAKFSDVGATVVNFNLLASDSAKISDTTLVDATFNLITSDAVELSDAPSGVLIINRSIVDAVKISDTDNVVLVANVSCPDGIKLDDSGLNAQCVFNVVSVDIEKISDIPSSGVNFNVATADIAKLSDVPSVAVGFNLLSSDAAGFDDTISGTVTIELSVIDAAKFGRTGEQGDEASTQVNFVTNVIDGIKLADIVSAVCNFVVASIDGLKLSDIVSVSVSEADAQPASGELVATVIARGLVGTINVKILGTNVTLGPLSYDLNKN